MSIADRGLKGDWDCRNCVAKSIKNKGEHIESAHVRIWQLEKAIRALEALSCPDTTCGLRHLTAGGSESGVAVCQHCKMGYHDDCYRDGCPCPCPKPAANPPAPAKEASP